MVLDAIKEARSQIQAFLRGESHRAYADPVLLKDSLLLQLKALEEVERWLLFNREPLPSKRDRMEPFGRLRDTPGEYIPDLPRDHPVRLAIENAGHGWYVLRDGPD
jgi:DNA polymerase III epsilon subunit-like protein